MFVLSTRNFPPETGGIQSLMEGLAQSLLNYGPVKVFADKKSDEDYSYDNKSQLDVERVSGIKLFRKYRKSNVVNEFVNNTNNIRALFVDHWKSLEHLNSDIISKTKVFCLIHSKEINHPKNSNQNKRIINSASKPVQKFDSRGQPYWDHGNSITYRSDSAGRWYWDYGNGFGYMPPNKQYDRILNGLSIGKQFKRQLTIGNGKSTASHFFDR